MLQFKSDNQIKWHCPGGRLDETEDSLEGLKREIKEETNLEASNFKPFFTKVFDRKDPKYGVFYICDKIEKPQVKISDEHNDFKLVKEEDLNEIDLWQPFYKELLKQCFGG